jgi:hypothetical protein
VATAIIITAKLNAMPAIDILIIGPEKEALASLLKVSLVAINNPVLNDDLRMDFKDIKLCSNFIFNGKASSKPGKSDDI